MCEYFFIQYKVKVIKIDKIHIRTKVVTKISYTKSTPIFISLMYLHCTEDMGTREIF
jgi:hypothetical protein